MKIALIHNAYTIRGGEERTVAFERALLERAGHDVCIYEVHNTDLHGSPVRAARTALSAPWSRRSYRAVRAFLERERPDIGHVHNWFPSISPSVYAAHHDAGIPVVQTLHNYRLGCARGTYLRNGQHCDLCVTESRMHAVRNRCYRDSAVQSGVWCRVMGRAWGNGTFQRGVDAYIAPSQVVAEQHLAMGLPADRMHVIPHACEDPGDLANDRGARDGALYVGRLVPEKGVETAIAAWRDIQMPLRIIGTGPSESELRRAAAGQSHIEFLGERSHAEVLEAMKRARLLVFPSRWDEPFGLTIIEAMACGTPILASHTGAVPELLTGSGGGWCVPPGNVDALHRMAGALSLSPTVLGEAGQRARVHWEQRFAPDRHRERLLRVFEDVRRAHAEGACA